MNILDFLREHPQWFVSVNFTDGFGVRIDVDGDRITGRMDRGLISGISRDWVITVKEPEEQELSLKGTYSSGLIIHDTVDMTLTAPGPDAVLTIRFHHRGFDDDTLTMTLDE